MAKPIVLNSSFKIVSYSGGLDSPGYEVDNLLNADFSRKPHCSGKGDNFDLVLEWGKPEGFTLSHFVARGASNCTAPLKTGLVWVSETKPNVEEYSPKFDNFTKEQFEALPKDSPHRPTLFFTTNPTNLEFQGEIPQWVSGHFVHVKFIHRHEFGGNNIDTHFIGLVGFEGKNHPFVQMDVPEELGITFKKLKAFNHLDGDFVESFQNNDSFLAITDEEELKEITKELAEKKEFQLQFFWIGTDEPLAKRILSFMGFPTQKSYVSILNLSKGAKFLFQGTPTKETVHDFCKAFATGTGKPFIKSAPRPQNDSDPDHPGLTILVASTFEELVLNSKKDVFVDLYADWCGPCVAVAPIIQQAAELLKKYPSVAIAKMDVDVNDSDRKYFPETSIPNMKFFPQGKKEHPIPYKGNRTLMDIVSFIHEHATEKFDLEEVKKSAADVTAKFRVREKGHEAEKTTSKQLEKHEKDIGEEKAKVIHEALNALKAALNSDTSTIASMEEALHAFQKNPEVLKLAEFAAEALKKEHQAALKNVKMMLTDEEFDKNIKESGDRLVVVDFTASWCGPCKMIAPVFANLSVEHPDVTFLKVDVDELSETAGKEGIRAMPTFHFYKKGEKIDAMTGASADRLKELVQKHK